MVLFCSGYVIENFISWLFQTKFKTFRFEIFKTSLMEVCHGNGIRDIRTAICNKILRETL